MSTMDDKRPVSKKVYVKPELKFISTGSAEGAVGPGTRDTANAAVKS